MGHPRPSSRCGFTVLEEYCTALPLARIRSRNALASNSLVTVAQRTKTIRSHPHAFNIFFIPNTVRLLQLIRSRHLGFSPGEAGPRVRHDASLRRQSASCPSPRKKSASKGIGWWP